MNKSEMNKTVGLIGVGIMGSAMGANLVRAGFRVVGHDPSPDALARLAAFGGEGVGSARAVAEACPVLISSLPSAAALIAACSGPDGIGEAEGTGQIVIECSTLPLDTKHRAFEILAATGKILLDCPVSGTGAQARTKDLVVLGSGDEEAFRRCGPVLDGMSRVARYLGPFGHGSKMKFLANHLVTIHNVAAAEAIVLGIKAGLDPALVVETLSDSAGSSRMFQIRGPLMRDARYDEPTATIRMHLKDLSIIGSFAADLGCPLPVFAASAPIYVAGAAQGRLGQDTAAVCAVLEGLAGLPDRPTDPSRSGES